MKEKKSISLKICGNPEANGGFMPLISLNSPTFEILDTVYSGFNENSYFFTVKIAPNYTVYKLIKNNVSSYGAIRQGSLVIGISIPKGYKLANEISPYGVLIDVLKEFTERCMTCKDKILDRFEFNQDIFSNLQNVNLNLKKYELVPYKGPYRTMTTSNTTGVITCPEEKIEELLKDVQYPEFVNYYEILVGNKYNGSAYTQLNNVEIPRPIEYKLKKDGVLIDGIGNDLTELFEYTGVKDSRYYVNDKVSFTILDLKNGPVDHVIFDEENETIDIQIHSLSRPKTETIDFEIEPTSAQNHFFQHRNELQIFCNGKLLNLDENWKFTLKAEELEFLSSADNFKVRLQNDKYTVKRIYFNSAGNLHATVEEKRDPIINSQSQTGNVISLKAEDAVKVKLNVASFRKTKEDSLQLFICYTDSEETLQSIKIDLDKDEQTFYIPKRFFDYSITTKLILHFQYDNYIYYYRIGKKEFHNISLKDFDHEKLGFIQRNKDNILFHAVIALLIGIIIGVTGAFIGYKVYEKVTHKAVYTENVYRSGEQNSNYGNNVQEQTVPRELESEEDTKSTDNTDITSSESKVETESGSGAPKVKNETSKKSTDNKKSQNKKASSKKDNKHTTER